MQVIIAGGPGLGPQDHIRVDDCPPRLRQLLRARGGQVAWTSAQACGISFREPLGISSLELRSLLAEATPLARDARA